MNVKRSTIKKDQEQAKASKILKLKLTGIKEFEKGRLEITEFPPGTRISSSKTKEISVIFEKH